MTHLCIKIYNLWCHQDRPSHPGWTSQALRRPLIHGLSGGNRQTSPTGLLYLEAEIFRSLKSNQRHYTTGGDCQLAASLNGVAARAGNNQTGKRNFRSVPCSDRLYEGFIQYIYTLIPSVILFFNIPVTIHSPDSRPPRCVCVCV